ncbi:MAG: orotidine 5'-phosphate decarboxylase [Thermoplasmata archaeon]|nr:orotidine 5'-phosphate decarboxylase [Thermoplasmata archaeon]
MDAPILQVALDMMHLKRAMEIAREAVEGGADWLEAGTPLIKSEGMEAVRELKRAFPGRTIVADMKVMDTGAYEVEMAAKAGADVVHVLGAADDETIRDAVRAGRKYNVKVAVDLIGVPDRVARAKEVAGMGVHHVCVHVSIDKQMMGLDPIENVKEVAGAVEVPVAVAGGINSETAPAVVDAGATVVIVGGAITKAEQPTQATMVIKESIAKGRAIDSELFKKYRREDVREALLKVSTSNISDAQHHKGSIKGLRPVVDRGVKIVGPALTVSTINGDWAKAVEAIDQAGPGDVLVIDAQGGEIAVWGELASNSCKVKGLAGVVIDGATRDVQDIRDIEFPVWARHFVPDAGEPKGHGEIGGEVEVGGQTVLTGDWIVGDESGLVVIDQDRLVEIANRALNVLEMENRLREEIRRGSTLSSQLELEKWERVG